MPLNIKIEEFRFQISKLSGINPGSIRLLYKGKVLCEELTLSDYDVEAEDIIDLM